MSALSSSAPHRVGDLTGQLVVVIGGSSGIGLETARLAGLAGADVVVTGRDTARLQAAADLLDARPATLDLGDAASLRALFAEFPAPIDHVLVTGGAPAYAPLPDLADADASRYLDEHLIGSLRVARECAARVRPGGSLTLITGTHARRHDVGLLGADLDTRRAELAATLPIRRVVGPADIAATAVHLMTNTAITGATADVDGGQQLLPA